MSELVGNSGKPRIGAVLLDNAIASLLSFVIAAGTPGLPIPARAIALAAIYLMYFLVPEAIWSATPGKMVFGLRVCRADGNLAGWREAAIRTVFRVVEVNPVLFGGAPAALAIVSSRRRQRIGDMVAGTVVIRSQPAKST